MGLDVVYPLAHGASREDDAELLFSLRSLRHVRDVARVHIFGGSPPWLTNVTVHPMSDDGDKALNLWAKYRAMVEADTSDPFLLVDDDHIFLGPTDSHPLYRSAETLVHLAERERGRTYGQYVVNTLGLLGRHGLSEKNFQVHAPLLIDKRTLRMACDIADDGHTQYPCVMGSLYGNLNLARYPVQVTDHDFAVVSPRDFDLVKDGPLLSIGEAMQMLRVDRRTGERRYLDLYPFLVERFGEPSPWETGIA